MLISEYGLIALLLCFAYSILGTQGVFIYLEKIGFKFEKKNKMVYDILSFFTSVYYDNICLFYTLIAFSLTYGIQDLHAYSLYDPNGYDYVFHSLNQQALV